MRRIRAAFTPRLLRYAIAAALFISIALWLRSPGDDYDPYLYSSRSRNRPKTAPESAHQPIPLQSKPAPAGTHVVDQLVRNAQDRFEEWLSHETSSLEDAAAEYRIRRRRHPPPGFEAWWRFATDHNAVMVEEFWDQIYEDLRPFWALEPAYLRREAADFEMNISVRNGTATAESDWFWTQIWLDLVKTIEHLLPDMDLALNSMDEPRLVVPWEDINKYVEFEGTSRKMLQPERVLSGFQSLPKPGEVELGREIVSKNWERQGPYWPIAARGCPPDSAAREVPIQRDFNRRPVIQPEFAAPHTRGGFVANATLATQFCHQPDVQGLQGFFIHPLTTSATKVLFPMFGGSKLAVNNEILLPPPMYWNEEERFTGGTQHGGSWKHKVDGSIWRGVATGGRNGPTNWRGFQRHRFMSMNNATELFYAEIGESIPENFAMPQGDYTTQAQREGKLANWVATWSDMGFTDLMCLENTECAYVAQFFTSLDGVSMARQFDYKYLPDIDGNSFSGRFIGFLRSSSLPIKATLFKEWSHSRLLAWKHYVPMDVRYGDWFRIMEYFMGYDGNIVQDNEGKIVLDGKVVRGHDEVGERIATDGKEWAGLVLRREDMQIYTLRVLLEYARLTDDRRDAMGWVEDLV